MTKTGNAIKLYKTVKLINIFSCPEDVDVQVLGCLKSVDLTIICIYLTI